MERVCLNAWNTTAIRDWYESSLSCRRRCTVRPDLTLMALGAPRTTLSTMGMRCLLSATVRESCIVNREKLELMPTIWTYLVDVDYRSSALSSIAWCMQYYRAVSVNAGSFRRCIALRCCTLTYKRLARSQNTRHKNADTRICVYDYWRLYCRFKATGSWFLTPVSLLPYRSATD